MSGASNSFTLISNVTSITGFGGGTATAQKTSSLVSPVHTYRGTIKDPAEFSLDLWYDPTDSVHKFLRNSVDTPTNGPFSFQVVWNTGASNSSAICNTVPTGFDGVNTPDVEENVAATFTGKITGATTWTNST